MSAWTPLRSRPAAVDTSNERLPVAATPLDAATHESAAGVGAGAPAGQPSTSIQRKPE